MQFFSKKGEKRVGKRRTQKSISADIIRIFFLFPNLTVLTLASCGGGGGGGTSMSRELKILPRMQATVNIVSGQKTILQYLIQPFTNIKNKAFRER